MEIKPAPELHGAGFNMERVTGIEPVSKAWEAFILPLNYTRKSDGQNLVKERKRRYRRSTSSGRSEARRSRLKLSTL